jgi:hypothetical protein
MRHKYKHLQCQILAPQIILTFNKFTGMAPNMMERSTLLIDLLRFHPSLIQTTKTTTTLGQRVLNNTAGSEQYATSNFVNYCV